MIHPHAVHCHGTDTVSLFQSLGYTTSINDIPVPLHQIDQEYLRLNVLLVGRTGERDWIKLHVYSLVEFPLAVLLDIRSLLLKPLDELYDLMLQPPHQDLKPLWKGRIVPIAKTHPRHQTSKALNAIYTKDYTTVSPQKWHVGIHTHFLIVKLSLTVFREFQSIPYEGNFKYYAGWGNVGGYGNYYGAMQSRGLLSYYYHHLYPGTSIELDRCMFNTMADVPYIRLDNRIICRDTQVEMMTVNGGDECRDCRDVPMENVRSVNYNVCGEP